MLPNTEALEARLQRQIEDYQAEVLRDTGKAISGEEAREAVYDDNNF